MTIIIHNNDIDSIDPDRIFMNGYCSEFAIALHQKTGLPLVVLGYLNEISEDERDGDSLMDRFQVEAVHAAVAVNDGHIFDIRGLVEVDITETQNWIGSFPSQYPDTIQTAMIKIGDDIELLESFMGTTEQDALDIAQKAIESSIPLPQLPNSYTNPDITVIDLENERVIEPEQMKDSQKPEKNATLFEQSPIP
jgi:hypothetical protein